jgi:uncharacterized membrane protein
MANPIELIVVVFEDGMKALNAYRVLIRLKGNHVIDIIDAAVLIKDMDGRILKKEMNDVDIKNGILMGAISGGLFGLLGGHLGFVVGATVGGLAARLIDMGFPEELLEELVRGRRPGNSAVIVLLKSGWLDHYLSRFEKLGGKVTHKVLKDDLLALYMANGSKPR